LVIGLITLCPLQAWALDPPRDIWPSRKGRPAKRTERDAQSLRVTQIRYPTPLSAATGSARCFTSPTPTAAECALPSTRARSTIADPAR
jgi:hypothetical protein